MGGGTPRSCEPRSSTSPPPCYHTPRRTKVRTMPTNPPTNPLRAPGQIIHAGTSPNSPEQSRTTLNIAEHRDQIGPPLNTAEHSRTTLNTPEHRDQIGPPLNSPEQSRTKLNTPEHPDQIGTPLNTAEHSRTTLNTAEHPDQIGTPLNRAEHRRRPRAAPHPLCWSGRGCAMCGQALVSPVKGGRDELGKRGVKAGSVNRP